LRGRAVSQAVGVGVGDLQVHQRCGAGSSRVSATNLPEMRASPCG
jgi:hypothetical protein